MPHYKTFTDQSYIGAYALNGQDLTVTIKAARKEEITGEGGRKQVCFVLALEAPHKPIILNATNQKSLVRLYGTETDNWIGKQFTLYTSTTQLAGETRECVRIRPTVGLPAKRPLTDKRFAEAMVKVDANEYSLAELLSKYELTEEQQARLPKQIADA